MGKPFLPYYGEDLGSAIQDAEKIISKIKTNKFTTGDLLNLIYTNNEIIKYIIENEN